MDSDQINIFGFMDSFNFEENVFVFQFFNVFVSGSPKIKRIRIRRDIGISRFNGLSSFGIPHLVLPLPNRCQLTLLRIPGVNFDPRGNHQGQKLGLIRHVNRTSATRT